MDQTVEAPFGAERVEQSLEIACCCSSAEIAGPMRPKWPSVAWPPRRGEDHRGLALKSAFSFLVEQAPAPRVVDAQPSPSMRPISIGESLVARVIAEQALGLRQQFEASVWRGLSS